MASRPALLFALLCLVAIASAVNLRMVDLQETGSSEPASMSSDASAERHVLLSSHNESESVAVNADYSTAYFEREYPGGWFASSSFYSMHVLDKSVPALLAKRNKSHIPSYFSVHSLLSPDASQTMAYFSFMWNANGYGYKWNLVYNLDLTSFHQTVMAYNSQGYRLKQVETYAFDRMAGVYYAALFISSTFWPSGTQFSSIYGVPYDANYCCGPSSRFLQLQKQGYKLVSISLTEDPMNRVLYVADVWDTANVGEWQAGVGKTALELSNLLPSLKSGLTPVYIKAYKRTANDFSQKVYFSYVAHKKATVTHSTMTADVGITGQTTLSRVLTAPPVAFTAHAPVRGVEDALFPGSGELYTAVWDIEKDIK